MIRYHYWAVRPYETRLAGTNIRIERALTPERACQDAFGRGVHDAFEYKDLGTRVSVIQSDPKRLAMLNDPAGWVRFRGRAE